MALPEWSAVSSSTGEGRGFTSWQMKHICLSIIEIGAISREKINQMDYEGNVVLNALMGEGGRREGRQ